MSATKPTVSIKLLIDTKKRKVLYAEAGKDFVHFLFNLLALPNGTTACLLKKQNMVGSLGNLYQSVESLSPKYMQPNIDKNFILKPANTASCSTSTLPLLLADDQMSVVKLGGCSNIYICTGYVSSDPTVICPKCKTHYLNKAVTWVDKKAVNVGSGSTETGGYVRGLVTYMVMDDLVVQPLSTIACITTLNKFTSMEVGALEEKVVQLNMADGLKLLKESLSSRTVLSNAFLPM